MLFPNPVAPPVTRILLPASKFFSNTVECPSLEGVSKYRTRRELYPPAHVSLACYRLVSHLPLAPRPAEDRAQWPTLPRTQLYAGGISVPGLFGPPFSGQVQRAGVQRNAVPELPQQSIHRLLDRSRREDK